MSPDDVDSVEDARYAERFPDWRTSRAARCPRVVAGHRCRKGASTSTCICEEPHGQAVLDHARTWQREDGSYVLTAEPYPLHGALLARFLQHCEELGLEVVVRPDSPYNPGETLLLIVRPAD